MSFIGQTSAPADHSRSIITNVSCDASVYAGAWVYTSGGVAFNAIATSKITSAVVGIVESKQSSTVCTIRFSGLCERLFSGLDESLCYFLSETVAGEMQSVPPTASGSYILQLGRPMDGINFLVRVGERIRRA